ncbi:MAG: hypothetical protein AAF903_01940 [Pseudomonadota bacterium]
MNMMVTEMYDALISAGADDSKARAAAEGLALEYRKSDQQFSELREDNQRLRAEMATLRDEISTKFEQINGQIVLLRWMLGLIIATNIAILFRVFWT